MSLLLPDLPNELLLYITSCFKHVGDINSFMQSNRQLYNLLNNDLYRIEMNGSRTFLLNWAIKHGNVTVAQKALEQQSISDCSIDPEWAMESSIDDGNAAMVELLLQHGIGSLLDICKETWHALSFDRFLRYALEAGSESAVRVLAAHRVKEGPVEDAAASDCDLTVEKFLTECVPRLANEYNLDGRTPLVSTIASKRTSAGSAAVRLLVSLGADPNKKDNDGETPLEWAEKKQKIDICRTLLECGASPDVLWSSTVWLGYVGSIDFHAQLAKLLLKYSGIDSKINSFTHYHDMLMNMAAICGSEDIIRKALETGSHEDTRTWGSRTFVHNWDADIPLGLAAAAGHLGVVSMLLGHGADTAPPWIDADETPLNKALSNGQLEAAEMLLHRGIGITIHGGLPNITPGARRRAVKSPQILQQLLDRGALDLTSSTDSLKWIKKAVKAGNITSLQILLDKGAPRELLSTEKMLDCAVRGGPDMLNFLIQYGELVINPGDYHTKELLREQIKQGNLPIVNFLFDHGCSRHIDGYLENAATSNDPDAAMAILDTLIKHGANVDGLFDKGRRHPYICPCALVKQPRKVIQFILERITNPVPKDNKCVRMLIMKAVWGNRLDVFRLALQAIVDIDGITPDEVQEHFRWIADRWDATSGCKLLEDFYWRKKYPVVL